MPYSRLVIITKNLFQGRTGVGALKMGLMRAHEHLGTIGERMGASAIVVRINERKLFASHCGHARAMLCKDGHPIAITPIHGLDADEYRRIRSANAIVTQVRRFTIEIHWEMCFNSRFN